MSDLEDCLLCGEPTQYLTDKGLCPTCDQDTPPSPPSSPLPPLASPLTPDEKKACWDHASPLKITITLDTKKTIYTFHFETGQFHISEKDLRSYIEYKLKYMTLTHTLLPRIPERTWDTLLSSWLNHSPIQNSDSMDSQAILEDFRLHLTALPWTRDGVTAVYQDCLLHKEGTLLHHNKHVQRFFLGVGLQSFHDFQSLVFFLLAGPSKTLRVEGNVLRFWSISPSIIEGSPDKFLEEDPVTLSTPPQKQEKL